MAKAIPELLVLNHTQDKPIACLRKVLDTLGVKYETATPKEGHRVIYEYKDIQLDPFLEPESIIFYQSIGKDLTLLTMVEQLSKVRCISFRTQLNRGKQILAKSDLVNDPGLLEDKTAGRLLVRASPEKLYLLFETKPGDKVGQCESSITIPMKIDVPSEQTLDIHLVYEGENAWRSKLIGKISVWNW